MTEHHVFFSGKFRGHDVWWNLWVEEGTRKVRGFMIPKNAAVAVGVG